MYYSNVTKPNFISKLYFNFIYKKIANIINVHNNKIILDFGCGLGFLKKNFIKKSLKVYNYDINPKLSDIKNWKKVNFEIIIFCQVLMYLKKFEIKKIFQEIKQRKKERKIIVVISKQNILNKFGAFILGHKNAHKGTLTYPGDEEKICLKYFRKIRVFDYIFFKILYLKTN